MSKKMLLVGLALAALTSSPVLAADLPARVRGAPVAAPAPAPSWAGFYLGLNAGGGFATVNIDDKDCYNCDSDHTSGGFGLVGGQIGYNWQMRSFVFGVEADGDWTSYKQDYDLCTNCGSGHNFQANAQNSTKLEGLVSARARAGLAFDNTLFYVTGGVAAGYMRNNYQYLNYPSGTVSDSFVDNSWHDGIVAGAGVEAKWTNNLTFRAEWLHYQLETKNVADTGGTSPSDCCQFGFGAQVDTVRLGMNYMFGGY